MFFKLPCSAGAAHAHSIAETVVSNGEVETCANTAGGQTTWWHLEDSRDRPESCLKFRLSEMTFRFGSMFPFRPNAWRGSIRVSVQRVSGNRRPWDGFGSHSSSFPCLWPHFVRISLRRCSLRCARQWHRIDVWRWSLSRGLSGRGGESGGRGRERETVQVARSLASSSSLARQPALHQSSLRAHPLRLLHHP